MVKQGQIIKINLEPKKGHEQKAYRPYLCLSNNVVQTFSNVAIFVPISNTNREYPFYIDMPGDTVTSGKVLIDQMVTIDYKNRGYNFVESVPDEFIAHVLMVAKAVFQKDE